MEKAPVSAVAALRNRALNLVYPPRCVFCQDFLPGARAEAGVCASCERLLPRTDGTTALRSGDYFTFCLSPLFYQGIVRESIRRYKFSGRSYYHRVYGVFLRDCLEKYLSPPPDVVTWAPLSARRKHSRGYDQARLLAEEAGKCYGLRPVPLLKKVKHTPAQSSLGRTARGETSGMSTGSGETPPWPGGVFCWWTTSSPPAPPCRSAAGCCWRPGRRRSSA